MKRTIDTSLSSWLFRLCGGTLFLFAIAFAATTSAMAQSFTEGFDSVASNTSNPLPKWVAINQSSPLGTTGWFQGSTPDATPVPGPFYAQSPDGTNSYIAANFNSGS